VKERVLRGFFVVDIVSVKVEGWKICEVLVEEVSE
jgi:hypothetical protein